MPVATKLWITFTNSLDPDMARQNVGPDLDPNFLKDFVKRKIIQKQICSCQKLMQNWPSCKLFEQSGFHTKTAQGERILGANVKYYMSQCMRFPTMWCFDKCRHGRPCAASF